jgi:hypothetical protein
MMDRYFFPSAASRTDGAFLNRARSASSPDKFQIIASTGRGALSRFPRYVVFRTDAFQREVLL